MRPFQLSAVLVSAGILLSGCYVFRGTVDRSASNRIWSEDHVCNVSRAPMVVETVVSTFFLTVAVVGFAASTGGSHSAADVMGNAFLRGMVAPGAALIALPFGADAVAGSFAVSDCADAKAEWRVIHTLDGQKHPST